LTLPVFFFLHAIDLDAVIHILLKFAAIGYCFGGTTVLKLAHSGANDCSRELSAAIFRGNLLDSATE